MNKRLIETIDRVEIFGLLSPLPGFSLLSFALVGEGNAIEIERILLTGLLEFRQRSIVLFFTQGDSPRQLVTHSDLQAVVSGLRLAAKFTCFFFSGSKIPIGDRYLGEISVIKPFRKLLLVLRQTRCAYDGTCLFKFLLRLVRFTKLQQNVSHVTQITRHRRGVVDTFGQLVHLVDFSESTLRISLKNKRNGPGKVAGPALAIIAGTCYHVI